ncbi:MAG: ribbon-helix-helix domain-containing protein [Gammaproteobacteria bacterium]|nr:ribbon-helix-helix domain-containing protein [Gammaproteobacteria bacterium]
MFRTTVYLDDEIAVAIRHLSKTQKRSQADIIRDALSRYLKQAERQGGRPPLRGIGAYRSGRSDVSEKAEELLHEVARKPR